MKIFAVIVWHWNRERKHHRCRDDDRKIMSRIWFVSVFVFWNALFFFLFFLKAAAKCYVVCVHVSAWQCEFDGGYNTSPFLPSFLPSLRECYHSISLPGTLAQSCRWDSRYELRAAQSDTLRTVEGKWERKGDLATRIKLSWYFQEAKTLFETKARFH